MSLADASALREHAAFETLDDPQSWPGFGRQLPAGGGTWESFLAIGGMHCARCALSVEKTLAAVPGVREVAVNGASAVARLVWAPGEGRPSAWFEALQRAGYAGLPAGDMVEGEADRRAARVMLWRWLVAGFCMMQVMMYTLPRYLTQPGEIASDTQALLAWAAWILTLPVVLFSCQPFFAGAWRDLRQRRLGMDVPVALGIVVTFAACSAAVMFPDSPLAGEVWYDSLTMFVFFLLSGRLLEQRLRARTAGALQSLARRMPATVERADGAGQFTRVAVSRLAPDDLIRVWPGEVIPADGEVTAGLGQVDEAMLTGEARALTRGPGAQVLAGSHNLTGVLEVQVQRTGLQTRFAEIVALMNRAGVDKPRIAELADRIASPFLLLVLLASAAAAWWWWPQGPSHALGVAVAVLIVTCPCALSLATPAATLAGAGALARSGVLVRNLRALHGAASVDTVLFDKTGTLSGESMNARLVALRPGADEAMVTCQAAALAAHSLHPVARALAGRFETGSWRAEGVIEKPGAGLAGQLMDGGEEGPGRSLRLGSPAFCGASVTAEAQQLVTCLADEAGWLATFEFDERPREDAQAAIARLQALGLDVQLLSGDRSAAVERLARPVGIEHWRGQCTPEDKLAALRELQRSGRRVAMVGDGMNDGPVLAQAQLSFAIGSSVPLAQARADVVIPGGQLMGVAQVLEHARATRRIVGQNLTWAALYNAACVPLAVLGMMPPWLAGLGMACSSLLVILNSARLARIKTP